MMFDQYYNYHGIYYDILDMAPWYYYILNILPWYHHGILNMVLPWYFVHGTMHCLLDIWHGTFNMDHGNIMVF